MAIYADREQINCHTCMVGQKGIRGCLKDFDNPREIRVLEVEIVRCPRKYVDGETLMWLTAYREYKGGFLPNEGGFLDQPMKFGQIMQIIDSTFAKLEEKENG